MNSNTSISTLLLWSPHLSLQVWLQAQQAANLGGFGMYYASTHEICRIRINLFQERRTKSNNLHRMNRQVKTHWSQHWLQGHHHTTLYLCFSDLCVHRMLCFEDILYFLLWTTKTAC